MFIYLFLVLVLNMFLNINMGWGALPSIRPIAPESPFLETPFEVYITKFDCTYRRQNWESPPKYRTIKLEDINAQDIQPVGRFFFKAKGKLYDAFFPIFKNRGIDKTNNIENPIDVTTFHVFDEEGDYFRDKNGLYYYSGYPTENACLSPNQNSYPEPISLQKITLQSIEEMQLYRGHKNNIFLPVEENKSVSFTPYAKLNGSLYWRKYSYKDPNGQFIKIIGADPEKFGFLCKSTFTPCDLYTDGRYVFLNGQITEIKPQTFQEITFRFNHRESYRGLVWSNFFKANGRIYYLTSSSIYGDDAYIINTEADPTTFEVIDTNGNGSGLVFRDKKYTYRYNKETKTVDKKPHL